jgi:hypothetical protein
MSEAIRVALEVTPKMTFATAIDWPGWSRSGKTPELALETLGAYAPRYAAVAREAGETLPATDAAGPGFEVVEQADGGGGTEFGVPSRITDADRRPTTADEGDRLRRLVEAAWTTFERVAASAPPELRKGPRGGGRDRDKMIAHVVEADGAYAREIGLRLAAPAADDRDAIAAMRTAVLDAIGAPSDGAPLADRKWTARYAASRIAWHALDHAWEMEDRSDPG